MPFPQYILLSDETMIRHLMLTASASVAIKPFKYYTSYNNKMTVLKGNSQTRLLFVCGRLDNRSNISFITL